MLLGKGAHGELMANPGERIRLATVILYQGHDIWIRKLYMFWTIAAGILLGPDSDRMSGQGTPSDHEARTALHVLGPLRPTKT